MKRIRNMTSWTKLARKISIPEEAFAYLQANFKLPKDAIQSAYFQLCGLAPKIPEMEQFCEACKRKHLVKLANNWKRLSVKIGSLRLDHLYYLEQTYGWTEETYIAAAYQQRNLPDDQINPHMAVFRSKCITANLI